MRFFLFFTFVTINALGQNNWFLQNSTSNNASKTDSIYRPGAVAISHAFQSPFNNRLLLTGLYGTQNARGQYISLNEPRFDIGVFPLAASTVGLATDPLANYQGLTINNYANFASGTTFTDVHNTSLEVNYQRGFADSLGFRDGGHLQKAATARFSGSFSNNGRLHRTDDFDLINLRLFTDDDADNPATIQNFYAVRMEAVRGVNTDILTNAWGIYMQPALLKNYFGGFVGIGTTSVTNALTVSAASDPVKLLGISTGSSENKLLSISDDGVLNKNELHDLKQAFTTTTGNTTLTDDFGIYVHNGGNAVYTLPPAADRTGKSWKIVNTGAGEITTSLPFYEGNETRTSILNKPGAYSYTLFSDGIRYISL